MPEAKIVVPQGMLKEASLAIAARIFGSEPSANEIALAGLEAALRWQRDKELTPEQKAEGVRRIRIVQNPNYFKTDEQLESWLEQFVPWVLSMHDEPESERPESVPYRWNARSLVGGGIEVCRGNHEKSAGCQWEAWPLRTPEPESVTNCRPLPKNYDDGRGRYKCSDCGNIFDPGSSFQSNCQNCVSIAHRVYLAKAYTAKHNGEPIPQPPSWIFLNLKEKMHGGSSIFDQGEESLCAIRLKDDVLKPEVKTPTDEEIVEQIKDLLRPEAGVWTSMIEAYRRGQKAGPK